MCDAEEGMSWFAGEGKYCTVCRWDEWDGMGWVGQEGKYGLTGWDKGEGKSVTERSTKVGHMSGKWVREGM